MGMLSLNSGKEGCERKYSFQVDGLDRVDGMVAGLVNVKKIFLLSCLELQTEYVRICERLELLALSLCVADRRLAMCASMAHCHRIFSPLKTSQLRCLLSMRDSIRESSNG